MTPANESQGTPRSGPALVRASVPYAAEDPETSRRLLTSTLLWAAGFALFALAPGLGPLGWLGSLGLGLVSVRLFIFYHDCMHGAIFRTSPWARRGMELFGLLVLAPPAVWRYTHNYHHAHAAQLAEPMVGDVPVMTVAAYRRAPWYRRLQYRAIRHPVSLLFGYATVFIARLCIAPLLREPRRFWTGGLALGLHAANLASLTFLGGPELALRLLVLPTMIGSALGAYLFYAQHNFPEVEIPPEGAWEYTRAALHASSMMKGGPLMRWITGDIGFHHVHHLNARIPFYRLQEALEGIPELQSPHTTSLSLRDIWSCLRLDLWDPARRRMVTFQEAARAR